MIKTLIIFLLVAAAAFLLYNYLQSPDPLEIKSYLSVTQNQTSDIEAPILNPVNYAKVEGTASNVSEKTLENIVLKFRIHTDTVEVKLGTINAGETKNFSTPKVSSPVNKPESKLADISYEVKTPD